MKRIKFTSISFAVGVLSLSAIIALASNLNFEKVDASSYSVTSPTTNIDLNDASDSDVRDYYSNLNSLSQSERQGTNLLKNLKPILKNGQKYLSYGSSATTAVWQVYEIVDRDWDKSPASLISGYNSKTNKITGYTYGTSNSSPGSNPYVHALYVNRSVTNQTRAWGNHNQDQWGINQEHVWAKSCGFNDNSPSAGARGDIMHLWAGNGKVNGTYHSNYYYGYVDTTTSYDDAVSYASTLSGNRKGKSRTLGGSYTVFEPQDSDKGDIARALFYMAARYNYLSGSDSDGIDAGNPNLEIVNVLNWAPGTSYTSSTSKKGQMGILQDLLEWNRLDPPDEWEIHRNNLCYNNYTNNRNPFIDFPEWAEFIWGKSTDGSYSSTPTGYATPNSDIINGYGSGSTVSVTGVSLNDNSETISKYGDPYQLIATVSPNNASNKNVTWTSSNTSVATVSSTGLVTPKAAGNTTITVTTVDGGYTATCAITVTNSTIAVTGVSISQNQLSLTAGESSTLVATVSPENATDKSVTWSSSNTSVATVSNGGVTAISEGSATITVTTTDGNKTATCAVTVTAAAASGDAQLYSGAITEGDYVIYYSGKALKNTITSGRADYLAVTPVNDVISNPDDSIVWHVASSGNYWTIYNESVNKYLASTGADNKAQLLDSGSDDKSLWTSSGSSTYEFINKFNAANSKNANLRENGTYGFACYSTSTGGALSLYKISRTATSITASVGSKTYYVGDTITASDITVTDNNGDTVTDFIFNGDDDYMFTYDDAASGGTLTDKVFEDAVVAGNLSCDLTVQVQRKEPSAASESIDVITIETTGVTASSYASGSFSGKSATNSGHSNAVYAGQCIKSTNGAIQVRTTSSTGIIATASGGKVTGVTVTWETNGMASNARLLDVYCKTSAYSSISDLFSNNQATTGTLVGSISYTNTTTYQTSLDISGNYTYIGLRSNSGVLYISEIDISYETATYTAVNTSDYIMYEDTNNQCTTKFNTAVGYLQSMSNSERSTFETSDDYVISTARERLEAWARHLGKTINYSDGSVSGIKQFNIAESGLSTPVIILVVISSIGIISIGAYFFLRRRKID